MGLREHLSHLHVIVVAAPICAQTPILPPRAQATQSLNKMSFVDKHTGADVAANDIDTHEPRGGRYTA